jgi:hypothetical protein
VLRARVVGERRVTDDWRQHGDRLLMQLDPSALPPPPAPTGLSDAAAAPVGALHGDEQQAYARARVEVG